MTYTTPELLVVGAAAQLVLEVLSEVGPPCAATDSGGLLSDYIELW